MQSREEYDENIKKIKSILKGEISEIEDDLKKEMISYAENLEFEKAQKVKEKLEILASNGETTILDSIDTINEYGEKVFEYTVGTTAEEEQEIIMPNTILSVLFGLFQKLLELLGIA